VQVNARPFFNAAASSGSDYVLQLCGQGYPLCRECTAQELVQQLLLEAEQAIQRLANDDAAAE
jgi:RecA-family ATPase